MDVDDSTVHGGGGVVGRRLGDLNVKTVIERRVSMYLCNGQHGTDVISSPLDCLALREDQGIAAMPLARRRVEAMENFILIDLDRSVIV